MRPLRILTWHVHGSYLWYLSHTRHELWLPVRPGRPHGYGGRSGTWPWPERVHEIPADEVAGAAFDAVLYQARSHWEQDRFTLLSAAQRALPAVYLEHDPPREVPTDTRHPAAGDPGCDLLVHCTHFNRLMWDNGTTPTAVVEHGVRVPDGLAWTGELDRGLVVVNQLASRGRRLGVDVFEAVRAAGIPLDLAGMESERFGGLGDLPLAELHRRATRYRFLFNPIRYTSLGLAVLEAMMLGLPVVGLATTELVRTVENGVSGHLDTDVDALVAVMQKLLDDRSAAAALSEGARRTARERFGIERFAADWDRLLDEVVAGGPRSREER